MDDLILRVENLQTQFPTPEGLIRAVDGVSFELSRSKTLALVGESGSGKSMTALSILQLVPEPGRIAGGSVWWEGENLLEWSESAMREIRGGEISMIFQEPMTSLNPVFTVGEQIAEAVRTHEQVRKRELRERVIAALAAVGIPAPETRAGSYPHELSGGMRQRVMIAMAMACTPSLLIADEPTTALDVTIQAQILDLMRQLQQNMGMSLLLITHDLGIVAEVADEVVVLYAGQVVEYASVVELFEQPRHPYTRGLLASVPAVGGDLTPIHPIPGNVPDPRDWPDGCRFAPRCGLASAECRAEPIQLIQPNGRRKVRCLKVPGSI